MVFVIVTLQMHISQLMLSSFHSNDYYNYVSIIMNGHKVSCLLKVYENQLSWCLEFDDCEN